MKTLFAALVMVLSSLFAGQAVAGPCVAGTFASYVALGTSGCEIGALTFTNFELLPRPNGASPIAAIAVNPFATASQVGFQFVTNQPGTSGQYFDDLISYRVAAASGSAVGGASISMVSTSAAGASVTTVQNLCVGGLFGDLANISGCAGTPLAQILVDGDPPSSLSFDAAALLAVVTDLGVDGGVDGDGGGFLASATNGFDVVRAAAIPEPPTLLLLSLGLVGFIGTRALRRRNA